MSSKGVLQERCAILSSKGVVQECRFSVSSQGVPQVDSLENVGNKYCLCSSTYVSAFGFVGFILLKSFCSRQVRSVNVTMEECTFVFEFAAGFWDALDN